jgi:hypothetical protein
MLVAVSGAGGVRGSEHGCGQRLSQVCARLHRRDNLLFDHGEIGQVMSKARRVGRTEEH